MPQRPGLNRERILQAAVELADEQGIETLSMRKLAQSLGGGAMSLYNHVAGKDDLLAGMVDLVFAELPELTADQGWREAMTERAHALRDAFRRHPWALGQMDVSPQPGPQSLAHHDAVLGVLRAGGFSLAAAGHAFSVLDSYIYGYCLQDRAMPLVTPEQTAALAQEMIQALPAEHYPALHEFTRERVLEPGYDYGAEFAVGLELVLDGVAALRERA